MKKMVSHFRLKLIFRCAGRSEVLLLLLFSAAEKISCLCLYLAQVCEALSVSCAVDDDGSILDVEVGVRFFYACFYCAPYQALTMHLHLQCNLDGRDID